MKTKCEASLQHLRNELASPQTAILHEERLISHPVDLERILMEHWRKIENWPVSSLENGLDMLEQWFCFVLPRVPMRAWPDGKHVHCVVRSMKQSTHGWDGWALCELKALPISAWTLLMSLLAENPRSFAGSVSSWYKRAPIPKSTSVCDADQIRPIDVHNLVVRIVSASACSLLSDWKETSNS